jgi:hypothetical protein
LFDKLTLTRAYYPNHLKQVKKKNTNMASNFPKLPGLVPTHDTWERDHKKISHKKLE